MATTRRDYHAAILTRRWAIEPHYLQHLTGRAAGARPVAQQADPPLAYVKNGVAVIPLKGVLLKDREPLFDLLGIPYTRTSETLRQVTVAAEQDAVRSIVLAVDSPGGEVAGTQSLASAVAAAARAKPVYAAIEDLGASAAYWVAAQARQIAANATAAVGSIGVYAVLDDTSRQYAGLGVRAILIRSGRYKGTGVPGVAIPDDELEPIQEEIDGLAAQFRAAVARGRELDATTVATLATGRTWLAPQALDLGLIDAVAEPEDVVREALQGATAA